MNEEKLLEKSLELLDVVAQLKLVTSMLENMEYARVTDDDFGLMFQIKNGVLGNLNDVVVVVNNSISRISNEICPDEKIGGAGNE